MPHSLTTAIAERYTSTDTDALLATLAGCTELNAYLYARRDLESACNYLEMNGRADEGYELRKAFVLINRTVVPVVNAQFQSIPTYSAEELIARAKPVTVHDVAALVSADLLNRYAPTLQAAE